MITQDQIDTFTKQLEASLASHYTQAFPKSTLPTITAQVGSKNVKIVSTAGSQVSVFCFLDRATGDILKAAGWNAPAKGARGHISNGVTDLTPYGPEYKIRAGNYGKLVNAI